MLRYFSLFAGLVFCVFAIPPITAQAPAPDKAGKIVVDQPGLNVRSRLDWTTGSLEVSVTRALDPSQAVIPRAKGDAETDIESRLGEFMIDALSPVIVDSAHTYGNFLARDPAIFAKVSALVTGARRQAASLSEDFSQVTVAYSMPLFGPQGLASPFYPSQNEPIPRRLGWVPTRPFTGVLIYAKGMLPAVGTNSTAQAKPAVYPRLFDENMSVVMEKGMCAPDALAAWGMVGYSTSLDDPVVLQRAGPLPLRLVARGVFGDNSTDIVISTEGALQLLTLQENIELLREGKVVVIYESLD